VDHPDSARRSSSGVDQGIAKSEAYCDINSFEKTTHAPIADASAELPPFAPAARFDERA
jgi:hypothetical protein